MKNGLPLLGAVQYSQFACHRIHYVAADIHIFWNQRMVPQLAHGTDHRIFYIVKSVQPFLEINARKI